jgi:hemerythrin-like metal-binding protein
MLGVSIIDQQHKQLVSIVNELFKEIKGGKANQALIDIFSRLVEYTASHFATEEKIFADTNYPETEEHIKHHKKLVESALKLQADFKAGNSVVGREVMDFLKDWLTNHILKTDKKYVAHFKQFDIK